MARPRYALCRGGPHDNERWPLVRDVGPGDTFVWEDAGCRVGYAVLAEIVQATAAPCGSPLRWQPDPQVGPGVADGWGDGAAHGLASAARQP